MKLSISSVLVLFLFAGSVAFIGYQEFKVKYGGILPYIKHQSAQLPGYNGKTRKVEGEGKRYRLALPSITEISPPQHEHSKEDNEKLEKLLAR